MSACGGENETPRYTTQEDELVEEIALDRGDRAWARVDRDSGDVPGSANQRALDRRRRGVRFCDKLSFLFEVARQQGAFAERPTRHSCSRAKRRQRFCADESLDGFWTSFRCHRRARSVGRAGVGGAVRIFTGHALDPDRGDPWGRRPRHDCAVRLCAAARKTLRTNGEGRDWALGWAHSH